MIEMLGYQIWLYGWFGYMGREHQFTGASVLASQKMWGGARVPCTVPQPWGFSGASNRPRMTIPLLHSTV